MQMVRQGNVAMNSRNVFGLSRDTQANMAHKVRPG